MITHSIAVYKKVKDTQEKFKGIYRSNEHKRFIHRRVLQGCKLVEGDSVSYSGHAGVVVGLLYDEDFSSVEWNDLECKCVEVFFYGSQKTELFHPNNLKRR
jgi:hypothetical protein